MLSGKLILITATALLTGSMLFADDATPPATPAPTHHSTKLTKPYSQLTDLTDDQKTKIAAIHSDYLDQQKALLEKEESDIEALLTDDQKEQLKTLQASKKSSMKKKEATTEPAQ